MRQILILFIIFFGFGANAIVKPIAKVNNQVITTKDLDDRRNLLSSLNPSKLPNNSEVNAQILQTLVNEKLLFAEADNLHINIGQVEIQKSIKNARAVNPILDKNFSKIDKKSLNDMFEANLIMSQITQAKFSGDNSVSDKEIEEFALNLQELKSMQFDYLTISKSFYKFQEITNQLKSDVKSCKDFENITSAYDLKVQKFNSSSREIRPDLREKLASSIQGTPIIDELGDNLINVSVLCSKETKAKKDYNKDEVRAKIINQRIAGKINNYIKQLRSKYYVEFFNNP